MQRIPAEQVPCGSRVSPDWPRVPCSTVSNVTQERDDWVILNLEEGGFFALIKSDLVWVEEGK